MTEVITKHMDIWTSALMNKSTAGRGSNGKQTAYGIKKLRELILELAMQGKLEPQDPNDEPASVLLKRITREKVQLVQEGKLAKQKPLSPISEDDKNFALPDGWEWTRFGNIFELEYGKNLPEGKRTNTGECPVYGSNGVVGSHDSYCVDSPCIVIGRKGSAGALNLCLDQKCWVTDVAYSVIPPSDLDLQFAFKLFQTLELDNLGKGIKPGLNRNEANVLPIAIPPISEQHRIVAKVDELMTMCDQLEQQQTDSNAAHQTLVETLLGTLTNTTVRAELVEARPSTGSGRTEFEEAWQRIAEHFDTLFTTEHSIDQLKQTILQLAVMGKLVPQDPNDEPASVLLEKIAKEKARLVKEGKVKKQNPLLEIIESEMPFELPSGWCFVRLENLCSVITKGSSPKWQGVSYTDDPADVLFITSENVGSYELLLDSKKYVEHKFNEIEPRSILNNGDFLMNIVGASIGRTAIYNIDELANINQAVCLIRLVSPLINSQYLLHFFNAETCVNYMFDKQVDNARANLSMGNIAKFVMPIPPQAEQNRIVAKVDELMALCDALKARINQAQTTQIHLADAIVEQAVA